MSINKIILCLAKQKAEELSTKCEDLIETIEVLSTMLNTLKSDIQKLGEKNAHKRKNNSKMSKRKQRSKRSK